MTPTPLYDADALARFAETYGADPRMVHVTGMDDRHTHADPDLDGDDPANPLPTEESAVRLAADFNAFDAYYAKRFPGQEPPGTGATVFRFGKRFVAQAAAGENAS